MTSAEYGHFVFCVSKQPTLFTFQFVNTCCGALVCHAPVKTFEGTGQVASIAAMAYQCCKIKTGCCELCLACDFCRIRTCCPLRVEATDLVYIPIRKHLLWCVCCHAPVKTFEGTGQVASIAASAYQCCKISSGKLAS